MEQKMTIYQHVSGQYCLNTIYPRLSLDSKLQIFDFAINQYKLCPKRWETTIETVYYICYLLQSHLAAKLGTALQPVITRKIPI